MSTNHRRDNDAPASDRAHRRWQEALVKGLTYIDSYREDVQEAKPTLTKLVVRCDPDDEQGVLVVCKGYIGTVWYVAFHRESTVSAAVSGVGQRLRNGSLKWREDEYEK